MSEFFDFQNHDPELLIETLGDRHVATWRLAEPGRVARSRRTRTRSGRLPVQRRVPQPRADAPEHAEVFANAGWTIDDIKDALHRHSRLPFRTAMVNKPLRRCSRRRIPSCSGCSTPPTPRCRCTRARSASSSSWSAPSPAAASISTAAPSRRHVPSGDWAVRSRTVRSFGLSNDRRATRWVGAR